MPDLSILITCLNDASECEATVNSIRATAGDAVDIIAVDDGSKEPLVLSDRSTRLIRHDQRAGIGPSRHVAALYAETEYLLIIDSHCRFEPGWYEKAMARIVGRPSTLHCGQCVGLREGQMEMSQSTSFYHGATINFYGADANNKNARHQILEGVWLPERKNDDDYQIPIPMGAAYFMPTDLFFHIEGLRLLRGYGSDEPFLGLKVWLAGGDVRLMKSVRIGHKFRQGEAPYATETWMMIYNKLAILQTCLPDEYARRLVAKFPNVVEVKKAMGKLQEDAGIIAVEKARYSLIFKRSFPWFLSQFNIPFPT